MRQYEFFATVAGLYFGNPGDLYDVFVDDVLPAFGMDETLADHTFEEWQSFMFPKELLRVCGEFQNAFAESQRAHEAFMAEVGAA